VKPIPPPGQVPPLDVDGYPKLCYVCGKPALKTGLRAIEYRTIVTGREVIRTTRHTDCKPE
jgi:hypothetical protein